MDRKMGFQNNLSENQDVTRSQANSTRNQEEHLKQVTDVNYANLGQQLADVMEPVGQHMHLANLMNASGMFRPQMTEKSNVVDDASQAHSLLANAPAHRSSDAFEKQRAKHESSELVPKDVHQIQEEISKIIEDTAEIVYQKRNEIQQNVENDISERFLTGNNGSASAREKAAEPQNYISGGTQQNYDANNANDSYQQNAENLQNRRKNSDVLKRSLKLQFDSFQQKPEDAQKLNEYQQLTGNQNIDNYGYHDQKSKPDKYQQKEIDTSIQQNAQNYESTTREQLKEASNQKVEICNKCNKKKEVKTDTMKQHDPVDVAKQELQNQYASQHKKQKILLQQVESPVFQLGLPEIQQETLQSEIFGTALMKTKDYEDQKNSKDDQQKDQYAENTNADNYDAKQQENYQDPKETYEQEEYYKQQRQLSSKNYDQAQNCKADNQRSSYEYQKQDDQQKDQYVENTNADNYDAKQQENYQDPKETYEQEEYYKQQRRLSSKNYDQAQNYKVVQQNSSCEYQKQDSQNDYQYATNQNYLSFNIPASQVTNSKEGSRYTTNPMTYQGSNKVSQDQANAVGGTENLGEVSSLNQRTPDRTETQEERTRRKKSFLRRLSSVFNYAKNL